MVFSASTVLDSKNKKVSTLAEQIETNYDKNFFDETFNFLNDENKKFGFMMEGFLDKAKETIREIDFATILSKIFDLFVSAIGNLISSFGAFMLNFVNKDAQLTMFKGKLANYRGNIRYTKPYYIYTNIEPNTNTSTEYKRNIDLIQSRFVNTFEQSGKSCNSLGDLVNLFNSIPDINMDEIRGSLVGGGSVTTDAFHDELFKYFRNGQINRTDNSAKLFEKNIDGNRIAVAYKEYYSANKQIALINREGMKYRVEALAAKASIRTFNPWRFLNKSLISPSAIAEYNKFVSKQCGYIRDICNNYLLFFAAKVDAIKEYNKTNKEILLLACKQMTRESGNND